MSTVPTAAAANWLYTRLAASEALTVAAPGGIWEAPAPLDVDSPHVAIQLLDAADTTALGASRVLTAARFVVRIVARDVPLSGLVAAAAAIDDTIHGHTGTVTDGTILGCVRERPFQLTEHVDGSTWRHLGGIYRIDIA